MVGIKLGVKEQGSYGRQERLGLSKVNL